ncbi:MAG: hypothetical protein HY928_13850 [Elusimicrobia bacterium]|nr:hypothetical protein [Elusimicrobiota bacterium]
MKPAAMALLLCAAPAAGAVFDDVGGAALQFLRLGTGARSLGMAEAYTAVASGAEAVYWNPGAMGQSDRPDFAYSHAEMLGLLRMEHAAYARPVPRLGGTMGVAASIFHQDSIPVVTNTNKTIGSFAPHGEAIAVAYSRRLFVGEDHPSRDRGFFQDLWRRPGAYEPLEHEPEMWTGSASFGLAGKFVSETIYDESAWAAALDAGVLFRPIDMPELAVSAVLRNLGTRPKFNTESESLPLEGSAGAALNIDFGTHRLLPAVEASIPAHGLPYGKVGFEYSFPVADKWRFALRGGYKSLTAPDLGPLSGLAGGIGLLGKRFTVDFAFQPMAVLGEVYRASFGWRFDVPETRRRVKKRIDGRIWNRPAPAQPEKAIEVEPLKPSRRRF